jgi:CheY-like chemotaxis protein
LIQRFLQDAGVDVVCVDNGRAACDAVREALAGQPFELVLMDLQMPEMDGLEAARCIHQAMGQAAPPIIALSASAMLQDREACRQAGMVDHIAKPVIRAHLYRTLVQWLADAAHGQALPQQPLKAVTQLMQPVPTQPVPTQPVPAPQPVLALGPAERAQRDAALTQLAACLSSNLLTALPLLEKIGPLISDPADRQLFQLVAQATRELRFAAALSTLQTLTARLSASPGVSAHETT